MTTGKTKSPDGRDQEDCCKVPAHPASGRTPREVCPHCGTPGRRVPELTLRSLLTPMAMRRRASGDAFFCAQPECPVVYYGAAGRFEQGDLTVKVHQKDPSPATPVCYCFGHSPESIAQDLRMGGADPAKTISAKVQAGLCACEARNPQGSCCLGNVTKVVQNARAKAPSSAEPLA